MSGQCFTLTFRCDGSEVRVTAAASLDLWPALQARLIIAGADALSVPSQVHGMTAGSFWFPPRCGSVVPEGFELDSVMRKLFVGFPTGSV